ncbi:MAG TPA: hypothetical protein VEK15_21595 [Vicinamibacteria bacterium]|nr:hypothetical protein [Vicinamibacteria bacterium]
MKLTIDFYGLCAVVRDAKKDTKAKNVDVLLLAAEKTRYSTRRHDPLLVFAHANLESASDHEHSTFQLPNGGALLCVCSLRGRVLTIRPDDRDPGTDALKVRLDTLPDLDETAHAGEIDPACLGTSPQPMPISARVRLGEGKVTCPKKSQLPTEWSFHPPLDGEDCYAKKFSNWFRYILDVEADSIVLEARSFDRTDVKTLELISVTDGEGNIIEPVLSISNYPAMLPASHDDRTESHNLAYYDLSKNRPSMRPVPVPNATCSPPSGDTHVAHLGPGEVGCSPMKMHT